MSVKKKKLPPAQTALVAKSTIGAAFDATPPLRHVSKDQAEIAVSILRTTPIGSGLRERAERALGAYLDANHTKFDTATIGGSTWMVGPSSIGTF